MCAWLHGAHTTLGQVEKHEVRAFSHAVPSAAVSFPPHPPDKSRGPFTAKLKRRLSQEAYPDTPWAESAPLPLPMLLTHLVWTLPEGERVG